MRKKGFWTAVGLLLALVLVTRLPILTHEMRNHPDEHVFVQGATSLRDVLLHGAEYTETKPYPEGAYFFFLPFQLLAELVGLLSGAEQSARVWNRLASVAYFTLGGAVGLRILRRYFGGGRSLPIYAVLLAFSLLHIEQSRYGTGEAISFALLMLLIDWTARWIEGGKNGWLFGAAALVGALGAVKYPLLFFSVLPLCAVFLCKKGAKQRAGLTLAGVALVLAAFLLLSPEVLRDWRYLVEVAERELRAYMLKGNRTEVGGPLNHAASLLIYWLGYSDLLLAPVAAFAALRAILRGREKTPLRAFFGVALPVAAAAFALYNLFVTAMFMRTLYPFFCIALLYTAYGAERLLHSKRALAGALLGLTVLRGALLIGAYLPDTAQPTLQAHIAHAKQIACEGRMLGLVTDRYMTGHWTSFREQYPEAMLVEQEQLEQNGFPQLHSGDVVVTGPLESGRAKPYLFPIEDEGMQRLIDGWAQFKEENEAFFVGRSYPAYYVPLFGFWINGVVSEFDFPMNFVYAVP
ncbi:MAG: hypothetical protein Q4A66_03605 [Eubacteriales bacterium]|nr:hypothetical protein [Eubacteriales bacterium]